MNYGTFNRRFTPLLLTVCIMLRAVLRRLALTSEMQLLIVNSASGFDVAARYCRYHLRRLMKNDNKKQMRTQTGKAKPRILIRH